MHFGNVDELLLLNFASKCAHFQKTEHKTEHKTVKKKYQRGKLGRILIRILSKMLSRILSVYLGHCSILSVSAQFFSHSTSQFLDIFSDFQITFFWPKNGSIFRNRSHKIIQIFWNQSNFPLLYS